METHHHRCLHGSTFLAYPLPLPQHCSWRTRNTRPFSPFLISCSSNNFPRWDSNAEDTFRPRNSSFNSARGKEQEQEEQEERYGKKRRWWSDEYREEFQEESSSGIWEEAIDSLWILKVFKSYGWTLPIILASWLLASGPKAFLMALALPLGQSALALAFEKLWGRSESKPKPKRKYRMRRKPSTGKGTKLEEEPEENPKTRKGKMGYQSWVVENNGSVDMGSREAPSLGGWDDLERSRAATRSSRATDGSQRIPVETGRLSRRERKSSTPLLLRLLIAIFPFLGTWTKML
ncbi:hypothetical protein VNO77_14306 [Canavalia gladiata]|uniref:Uncharacterized protein n=1 Tax=Canavalia gladiata TaxID=3824 RepID=A0AAN9LZA5_CANGL